MAVQLRLLGVLAVLTVLTYVLLHADGKPLHQPKVSARFLSTLSMDNEKQRRIICHNLCSDPDSYCPPSCPEHMFSSLFGGLKRGDNSAPEEPAAPQAAEPPATSLEKKRGPSPFDSGVGSLTFEDYMFLKMMGRI